MDSFFQDLRYGLRMLLKSPGFTAVAVITLALGIGANTAVFSIVNAVLLRPLPYRDPQQLVKVWGQFAKQGIPQNWISEPEWWDLQHGAQSFSALAAYTSGGGANLATSSGQPARVRLAQATASLFPLLGVNPVLGRPFSAEEDQPGRDRVVLLSYAFWTSQFGGDSGVPGRTIQLNAESYTIVGVLPKAFSFAGENDIWTPLGLDSAKPQNRGSHYLEVLARLKPGVTLAQAGADVQNFAAAEARQYPNNYRSDSGWGMFLVPLRTELVGDVRLALLVLLGAVGFVLLIACVNLANLLLARASARTREIALRAALGAGRIRLIRQFLTESVVLAVIGGTVGVLLAVWIVAFLRSVAPASLPQTTQFAIDARVLVFAAAVSLVAGLLFGIAPAMHVAAGGLFDTLKTTGRSSSGVASNKLRSGLVVTEISIALVLLVGAGLMVRSLQRLLQVTPGFQTQRVLTARLALPNLTYKEPPALHGFYREFVARVQHLPGVEAAGAISLLPMSNSHSSGSTFVESTRVTGLPVYEPMRAAYIEADRRYTAGAFFESLHVPLLRGRLFTDSDGEDAPLVAIVDEAFAHRFWPEEDAIGKRIAIGAIPKSDPPQPQWRTVVGVVGHVKNDSLDQTGREQAYFPQSQVQFVRSMTLVARTTADPSSVAGAIRAQLSSLDPSLPVYEIKTMADWIDLSVAQRRFNMALLVAFAALALALAAIGTYGVISYSVSQRTQEIGIRMALGAGRGQILKMVVGGGMRLAVTGIAIGAVAALIATRFMAALLFGVGAVDPITFAAVAVVLGGVAFLAAYLPARRATRVNPVVALRYE